MKKFLFYLGHPNHYHVFKRLIKHLKNQGNKVTILIKKKDILEDLLHENGIDYINILPGGRSNSLAGIGWGLVKRDYRLLKFLRANEHDILIGSEPSLAHVGRFLGIPSFIFAEDDNEIVPLFSHTTYPLCDYIVSPEVCNVGKWKYKKISYPGYQKLTYLHPDYFTPSLSGLNTSSQNFDDPFFLIRLSGLTAYHDKGVKGFDNRMLKNIVSKLTQHGNIYISSEKELPDFYTPYLLDIDLNDIHHVLAHAQLFISDSQSMSIEASMLGTPSLRLSDLARRISVLEELEHKYDLTFGFKSDEKKELFDKLDDLLKINNIKENWKRKRSGMLEDKINVNDFYCWLFDEYPRSVEKLDSEPNFINTFK